MLNIIRTAPFTKGLLYIQDMYGMSRADSWGRAVTDTVEQTIAVDAHETDVLDPRTDAPAGKEPVTMAPVDLGPIHVPTPVVLSPMAGVTNWPFRVLV